MLVVIREIATDEIICTLTPEDYEDENLYEVLDIDREPEEGEVWNDGWEMIPDLDNKKSNRAWNTLPEKVRVHMLMQELRIRALEQSVQTLQSQVSS